MILFATESAKNVLEVLLAQNGLFLYLYEDIVTIFGESDLMDAYSGYQLMIESS